MHINRDTISRNSDAHLVESALSGEAEAFDALVKRFQRVVYAVAFAVISDREAALDVLQESFIAAYRQLHTLDDISKFGPWICAITRNLAKQFIRVQSRRAFHELPFPEGDVVTEKSAESVRMEQIRDALACLTETQTDVVTLFYMEGYSVAECAELLGVPQGTIKRRLHDARQRLKKEMTCMIKKQLPEFALPEHYKYKGAITAADVLAGKGLNGSTFHFPIAITFNFKGMADLAWWQSHSSRFAPKRINHPGLDDSSMHWGKVLSSCPISVWNIETEGVPIIFVGPLQFGPHGAVALEELKVFGLEYVIGVGAVGAFSERLNIGDILIADRAIVSDGTSKVYTDEPVVYPSSFMQSLAEETFHRSGLPVDHTCVWQSDALYRESLESRKAWRMQGAECVNCETSTLYAVSRELGIESVSLNWVTDSTVSGKWTGWGGLWVPPAGKQPPVPQHRYPLEVMEDLAIEMAREIKRTKFGNF